MKLEISDLKVIIELAAQVVLLRHGDISTENGSYATTDCDSIIRLDRKIADTFDLDSDDVTFENMNNLLGKIDDVFNAITAVYTSEPISESSQLASIESRLSSIEKLLSADSEPLSPSEYKAIWHGEVEQEPEWRPMSEAPLDGTDVILKNRLSRREVKGCWHHVNRGWICESVIIREDVFSGWRRL